MQPAIAMTGLFTFLGGAMSLNSPPGLFYAQWQTHAIQTPALHRLTQGRNLLFLAGHPLSRSNGQPRVTQVYPVDADLIAVEIETGFVIPATQIPYEQVEGDRIQDDGWVSRRGKKMGSLVGRDRNILYPMDQWVGAELPDRWANSTQSFQLTHSTDATTQAPQSPVDVFRKTKPINLAETADGKRWEKRHTLYLKWATPLQPGQTYTLSFRGLPLEAVTFTYDPQVNRSEAVHVAQTGFHPQDPVKVAFLSTWMGTGGPVNYGEGMTFWVINAQTDEIVYEGKTRLSAAPETREDGYRNYNQTPVYALDFATVQQPGLYRVCVARVGCSFNFPIAPTVWRSTFQTTVRGLYHQRSGIAIEPPYSHYSRPRAFHPDDGVVVYQSTAQLMNTNMGIGSADAFEALLAGKTATTVPNAWGGYFDAGDWDRRIQHLETARSLLELMELFPDKMAAIALNIPESNNALPDVLDEALWSIDFYQRLQHADGGIPGGIESAGHPRRGETSWQESLTVMAYAPDIWSSYWYAAAAAQAAFVVKPYDSTRAQGYESSALKAFAYAEQQYPHPPDGQWPYQVRDLRNLAALELWRLTGNDRWHEIFLAETLFTQANVPLSEYGKHDQASAAFLYSRLASNRVNTTVQNHARQAILQQAQETLKFTQVTGFQWAKEHPLAPFGWGTSWAAPRELRPLAWAHFLTQDDAYLEGMLRASQFSLGANPDNLTYTTGLGMRSPQHPLILDQRIRGVEPPPGITVYGPIDISNETYKDYWFTQYWVNREMVPPPPDWPPVENFMDIHMNVAMSEFTIHETIGPSAYVWGYLAAQH